MRCDRCGYQGSLAEFTYVAQAYEAGATALRRCPSCKEIIAVDELELEAESSGAKPWGLGDIWGRKFSRRDREAENG